MTDACTASYNQILDRERAYNTKPPGVFLITGSWEGVVGFLYQLYCSGGHKAFLRKAHVKPHVPSGPALWDSCYPRSNCPSPMEKHAITRSICKWPSRAPLVAVAAYWSLITPHSSLQTTTILLKHWKILVHCIFTVAAVVSLGHLSPANATLMFSKTTIPRKHLHRPNVRYPLLNYSTRDGRIASTVLLLALDTLSLKAHPVM